MHADRLRHAWVDVAKGICIIAVVGLYATHELVRAFGDAGWLTPWSAFAKPFRMPDFFLLSGLFLSAVIDRPWRSYLDTKVVHYAYFLVLWVSLIYLFDVYVLEQDPYGASALKVFKLYVWSLLIPDHMLWFIQILPAYFVATRLLRMVPSWLLWMAALALQVANISSGFKPLDNFNQYYVFFLTGHFAASWIHRMCEQASRHPAWAATLFVIWCVINQSAVSTGWAVRPGWEVVFGFLGITAVVSFSSLMSCGRVGTWIARAGANSIVIYLGFYIPMRLFIGLLKRLELGWSPHLLAVATVLVGVAAPALLQRLTATTPLKYLFIRPHWAYLPGVQRER